MLPGSLSSHTQGARGLSVVAWFLESLYALVGPLGARRVSHWPECQVKPRGPAPVVWMPCAPSQPPPVRAPSCLTPLCAIHSHAGWLLAAWPGVWAVPALPKSWTPSERGVRVLPFSLGVWVLYPGGWSVWVPYPIRGVSEAPCPTLL